MQNALLFALWLAKTREIVFLLLIFFCLQSQAMIYYLLNFRGHRTGLFGQQYRINNAQFPMKWNLRWIKNKIINFIFQLVAKYWISRLLINYSTFVQFFFNCFRLWTNFQMSPQKLVFKFYFCSNIDLVHIFIDSDKHWSDLLRKLVKEKTYLKFFWL